MLNNTMIVSDIDDTIKWSHILGSEKLIDALNYRLAFKGMPELYRSLANAGATVAYVTGAPDIVVGRLHADSIPQKVVSENHFPQGEIWLHQLGESIEAFKVAKITQIMKDHPGFEFILIGDNGQKDVETYATLRQDNEIGSRVRHVFIHSLYHGGMSLEPKADQYRFFTPAELAAVLYGLGLLGRDDLMGVVKIVHEGMNGCGDDHNLTLPAAAQLAPAEVDDLYRSLPTTIDSPIQALLSDIHDLILEQAKRGPRAF